MEKQKAYLVKQINNSVDKTLCFCHVYFKREEYDWQRLKFSDKHLTEIYEYMYNQSIVYLFIIQIWTEFIVLKIKQGTVSILQNTLAQMKK